MCMDGCMCTCKCVYICVHMYINVCIDVSTLHIYTLLYLMHACMCVCDLTYVRLHVTFAWYNLHFSCICMYLCWIGKINSWTMDITLYEGYVLIFSELWRGKLILPLSYIYAYVYLRASMLICFFENTFMDWLMVTLFDCLVWYL